MFGNKQPKEKTLNGNFEVTRITHGDYGYQFQIDGGKAYRTPFYVHKSPTCNCQMASIGAMESIFTVTKERAEVQSIIKTAFRLLAFDKPLLLLDVRKDLIEDVEKCFKVHSKTPYTNTNGTSMCLFLVKMDY